MCRTLRSWGIYSTIIFLIKLNLFSYNKYIINCDENIKILSYNIALNEVGTLEKNINSGEVLKYLKSVDINYPSPYCMAGQYWSFEEATRQLNKQNPLYKTGSASQEYNLLKANSKKTIFSLNKYDLVFWRQKNHWKGHVERIASVGRAGWIETIAFNVKSNGKEGVFVKRRNIFHPLNRLFFIGAIGFEEIN